MMTSIAKEEDTATNDPYHDLRTIKFLSLILIVLGLLFSIYLTIFIFGYHGRPQRLVEVGLLLIPYLYLFAFFLCCLRIMRGRALVVLCVICNLPLVVIIGYALINLSFVGIVLSIYPLMWILLCREQLKLEGTTSPENSFNGTAQ